MLKLVPRGKKSLIQIIGKLRGQRVHHSTGSTSWAHAEAERIKIENQILDQAIYGTRATAVFAESVEVYLDGGGSPRFVAPLNEHFGRWRMSDITQAEIMRYTKLAYPDASPQTLNRQVITPLIAVWRAAQKAKLCGPHEFVRPRQPEQKPVVFAKDDYVAQLLPACSMRLKAAILLITSSGARATECCNLSDEEGHVDWNRRTALLYRTKNGKPRTVVMPALVYRASGSRSEWPACPASPTW